MKTINRQKQFARMLPRLLDKAHELGYEVTLGDAYRDSRVPYGHPRSLHRKRLAIDLNLFRDGEYLNRSEDYQELGEWWTSNGPEFRWGGMMDGNHFAITDGTMTF